MIAYLNGNITHKSPTNLIIECNQVGYWVNISLHTYSQVQNLNQVKLLTHLHVTESAHTLYGFFEELEKTLFTHLISVSGIGPATARMAFSSIQPYELHQAIIHQDIKTIQSIKGVGPKSAQRIILELKDKLLKSGTTEINTVQKNNTFEEQALSALLALGFARAAAEKAVSHAVKASDHEVNSVEDLIKKSLKLL